MNEAYVRLLCPECRKHWETKPKSLPKPEKNFSCPNCHASHRLAEFMRTEHDLETLKRLQR